jgi:hypothetical protein
MNVDKKNFNDLQQYTTLSKDNCEMNPYHPYSLMPQKIVDNRTVV